MEVGEEQSKMQAGSFSIWAQDTDSISYDNMHDTISASNI